MFVGAKVLSVCEGIYHVEIEDSNLGLKRVSFIMPHYNPEKLHRVIAALHEEWMVKGNGNPVEPPLVDAARVNGIIAEYQLAKEEEANAENDNSGDSGDIVTGDNNPGGDDIEHTAPEGEGFPCITENLSDAGSEQSILDSVDEALKQPVNQGGDPAAAASAEPAGEPGVEPVSETSGDGQDGDSDEGEPQPGS